MATPKKPAPPIAAPVPLAAPENKPKRSKLVPIVLAVLIASGAGGGGWFYLQHKNAQAKAAPKAEKTKPPVFLPIDQFTVNLSGQGGEHFLQIAFTLEVADAKVIDELKQQLPIIRSRLLLLLASKTAEELSLTAGKQKLMGKLLAEARTPLAKSEIPGKGVVNVHFSAFVIQ